MNEKHPDVDYVGPPPVGFKDPAKAREYVNDVPAPRLVPQGAKAATMIIEVECEDSCLLDHVFELENIMKRRPYVKKVSVGWRMF